MNKIIKIVLSWIFVLVSLGLFAEHCVNREVSLLITGTISFIYGWVFVSLFKYSVNNLINNKNNKQ